MIYVTSTYMYFYEHTLTPLSPYWLIAPTWSQSSAILRVPIGYPRPPWSVAWSVAQALTWMCTVCIL